MTRPSGIKTATFIFILVLGFGWPLAAEEGRSWRVYAGTFNFDQEITDTEAGFELRFPSPWRGLSWVGGVAGTEEGSFWAYGGAQYAWHFTERWAIGPGFAVSLYEQGDGKDLGGVVEFRSNLELSTALTAKSRLALAVYHLSNAGLYEDNPGSNSLVLAWSRRR